MRAAPPMPSDCRADGRDPVRSSSAGPNAPSKARVAGVLDQSFHAGADGGEEIGGEVGIGVDRILDRARRRMVGLFGDAGDRRQRQFRRAEQQIAVAALERRFLAHLQAGRPSA